MLARPRMPASGGRPCANNLACCRRLFLLHEQPGWRAHRNIMAGGGGILAALLLEASRAERAAGRACSLAFVFYGEILIMKQPAVMLQQSCP